MRERERRTQAAQRVHHFRGEPTRQEKIEVPAELGAARIEPLDARQQVRREACLRLLHRRDVDPHPADPNRVEPGEQPVRRILVDIDDAAASGHASHGVQHTGVVAAVGARLNEHEAREAEPLRLGKIILEGREGRRIAQLLVDPAVSIPVRRPEYVEMGVAALRWRFEQRCDVVIGGQVENLEAGRGAIGDRSMQLTQQASRRLIPFMPR